MQNVANFTPTEFSDAITKVFANGLKVLHSSGERLAQGSTPLPYDPTAPLRAFADLSASLFANPAQLLAAQQRGFNELAALWGFTGAKVLGQEVEPVIEPEKGDRRFKDPAWSEHAPFDFLKQSYLLANRQILEMIADADLDEATRTRVTFFARQWLQAISPANFAFTNPEALRKAFETGGVSLLGGLANMLEDSASSSGLVQRRAKDGFELGVNIAATPGGVVFQNELMQLIQYAPSTETVYRRPLLYIPPLVNKYYILDLQPHTSLIKWLVDQGHTVFVTSWVNPGPELRDQGVTDYIKKGPVAALEVIEGICGERQIDVFGFCMGGTLTAMAAAYLTERGDSDRLGSLTLIGTLLEFTQMGEWATFYEPQQLEAFGRHVQSTGVIASEKLQGLFSAVRANDLIWASVVNHYLLDQEAPASDILYWFADGARIPAAFLLEYADLLLRGNKLREAGAIQIDGAPIDLKKVTAPVMMISLKDDHVSAWDATYTGARLFGGPAEFLLGGSGHNAGVINPPAANKHGYWFNPELPDSSQDWFAGARKESGSWWPKWQEWLAAANKQEQVPARPVGAADGSIIEPAPGSYVRVK